MTAFESPFLFLRNPRGGVENLLDMQAAGFAAVFCNVGDFSPDAWATVRQRAVAAGMQCGPWLHTREGDGRFSPSKLEFLCSTARAWQSPVIVNTESEAKGSGDAVTGMIVEETAGLDAAVSMEAWPFADVYWVPLGEAGIPVLPQIFPEAGITDPGPCVEAWWSYGVECVWPTFASYGGRQPSDYDLQGPYSLYTADDCGGVYARWGPTSTGRTGCYRASGGASMETIGPQHGIDAAVDRLVSLDPSGTKPNRNPNDLNTWGAYDKLRRTLKILAADHDEQASKP